MATGADSRAMATRGAGAAAAQEELEMEGVARVVPATAVAVAHEREGCACEAREYAVCARVAREYEGIPLCGHMGSLLDDASCTATAQMPAYAAVGCPRTPRLVMSRRGKRSTKRENLSCLPVAPGRRYQRLRLHFEFPFRNGDKLCRMER